jgi:PAS domain S-box-containing protein
VSLVRNEAGQPQWFVSVIEDISDRKQAEEKLRENEASLNEAQKIARIGSWSWNVDSDMVKWSRTLYEITGLNPEYPPPSYEEHPSLYTPESWERLSCAVERAVKEGKSYDLELIMVRTDGQRCHTSTIGKAIKNSDGRIVELLGTVQDITERKRIADDLIKSEMKYRDLVDNSMVGVFTSSLDGRFLFVNDAIARMYDFDSTEQMVAEGSIPRWADPKKRERMMAALQKHGSVTNFEAETITHTGRNIHVLLSAKLHADNISGMLMDITDRKRAEQKILDYQQRLKALAYQLTIAEEKERHAIATNLHDHVGQSLALARMQLASARQFASESKLVDKLDDISNTLLKTLEDTQLLMLELSSSAMHETGLSSAISEWLENHIKNRHSLKTEVIDNISQNRRKILDINVRTILFRNVRELLVNVVKHARANKASVRLEDRNTSIRIIVEDDGIGFEPHVVTQVDSKTGGFGLFSIQELMADLGGNLKIVSEPGKGCTAILSAPFGDEEIT